MPFRTRGPPTRPRCGRSSIATMPRTIGSGGSSPSNIAPYSMRCCRLSTGSTFPFRSADLELLPRLGARMAHGLGPVQRHRGCRSRHAACAQRLSLPGARLDDLLGGSASLHMLAAPAHPLAQKVTLQTMVGETMVKLESSTTLVFISFIQPRHSRHASWLDRIARALAG